MKFLMISPIDIALAFAAAVLLYTIAELVLTLLNVTYVKRHANTVPAELSGKIDSDTHQRAVHYTLAKGHFSIVSLLVSSSISLSVVLSGFLGSLDTWLRHYISSQYLCGLIFIFALTLFFSALELPLSLYRTFVIEERFGFNKTSLSTWVTDRMKGLLLGVVIAGPLLLALFWFMDNAGAWWWLIAAVTVLTVQLILVFVFPVLIAPLFNRFEPLPEGTLKHKIIELADKLKFRTSGIFCMDGSKRSAHGNAYFTGFGSNKRIVLFDTLVNQLNEAQVVAVLAHEIGHEKMGHVKKMLLVSSAMTILGFWLMSLGITYEPLYSAFGFGHKSSYAALTIFSMLSSPLMYFVTPLVSALSRRHEYQADRFAQKACEGPEALIEALVKLSKNSLSNLTPHPLYSAVHYSHPTLIERVKALS